MTMKDQQGQADCHYPLASFGATPVSGDINWGAAHSTHER